MCLAVVQLGPDSSGTMSDLGSHWIDLPFWALELKHPLTIEASGPPPHPEIAPASMQAVYEYGPRGDQPAAIAALTRSPARAGSWRVSRTSTSSAGPAGSGGMNVPPVSGTGCHGMLIWEAMVIRTTPAATSTTRSPGAMRRWMPPTALVITTVRTPAAASTRTGAATTSLGCPSYA